MKNDDKPPMRLKDARSALYAYLPTDEPDVDVALENLVQAAYQQGVVDAGDTVAWIEQNLWPGEPANPTSAAYIALRWAADRIHGLRRDWE